MSKLIVNVISSLLQRGRHAKIHVVLAAQNPTFQNMRVDLGNITARMAFKCAKKNFSEVILGESGAESLIGQGDMYFKYPQCDRLQRIQGAFVAPKELQIMVNYIGLKWKSKEYVSKFSINEEELQYAEAKVINDLQVNTSVTKGNIEDKLFAEVVLWVLGQNSVSCNTIMKAFNFGWNRANRFMERLNEMGIVDDLDAKLPRMVIPQSADEISDGIMQILEKKGVSAKSVMNAISKRVND